jgi:Flp pilus assembly pilin Flp
MPERPMRWDRPTDRARRLVDVAGSMVLAARAWLADAGGQGLVEYGLILSLSALFAVVVLVFFGGTLSAVLQAVGDAIDSAT